MEQGYVTFQTSSETDKLDAAIAKVQGEIGIAVKNRVNPHYKSKYADLASVWEACRAALSKNGVSVMQFPIHTTDNRLHLLTRVAHGGQWIQSHFSIPVEKNNAHGYGSSLTYIRRFSLAAVVGISDEEDDDGNVASGKVQKTSPDNAPPAPQEKKSPPKPPTDIDNARKAMFAAARDNGWTDQDIKDKAQAIAARPLASRNELTLPELKLLRDFFSRNKKPAVGSNEDIANAARDSEYDQRPPYDG